MRTRIADVGSKPAGAGRYGHLDFGGPLWEWTVDAPGTYPATCTDCANVSTSAAVNRSARGCGFNDSAPFLRVAARINTIPKNNHFTFGIRCARSP